MLFCDGAPSAGGPASSRTHEMASWHWRPARLGGFSGRIEPGGRFPRYRISAMRSGEVTEPVQPGSESVGELYCAVCFTGLCSDYLRFNEE